MQRRHVMPQRSPVISWLLLAASIAVDAVVLSWIASETYPGPLYLVVTFHALVLGQVSLVCIWSAVGDFIGPWRRSAPVPAVFLAAAITATLIDKPVTFSDSFANHLAYFGMHAALLVAALWLIQRTNYWRQRSGTSRPLRFSLAQLLIVMTVVAVLATTIRSSPFFGNERWINLVFLGSSVALAIANVLLWNLSRHGLLRLAGAFACAILCGIVFLIGAALTSNERLAWIVFVVIGSHYLIQTAVISVWLGWGQILPNSPANASDD
jgi:hypothetical protein